MTVISKKRTKAFPNKVTVNKEAKPRVPTATLLTKLLNEAKFNPKTVGPMKVVADLSDPGYYETRAIELILEAKEIREHQPKWWRNNERYHVALNTAIQFLSLARAV
jgi:hypothetical protein